MKKILLSILIMTVLTNGLLLAQSPTIQQRIEQIVIAKMDQTKGRIAALNNKYEANELAKEQAEAIQKRIMSNSQEELAVDLEHMQDSITDAIQKIIDSTIVRESLGIEDDVRANSIPVTNDDKAYVEDLVVELNNRYSFDERPTDPVSGLDNEEMNDSSKDIDNELDTRRKNRNKSNSRNNGKDGEDGEDGITVTWNNHSKRGERGTTSQFVMSFGGNNLREGGNILDDKIKTISSRSYEFGITFKNRLLPNSNFLQLKYGISYLRSCLRTKDDYQFIDNGNQTNLTQAAFEIKKNRFRNSYWMIPLHLEFDFSKKRFNSEGKPIYRSQQGVRIGIGAHAGVRVATRQMTEAFINKQSVETTVKAEYNTNDYIYGWSAYAGYHDTSIMLRYDMSPLFPGNTNKQNNVSIALRFDLH